MPASDARQPRKILIADDNPQNLYLLRAILESAGAVVEEAANGREALDRAKASPPDLVISDALMPEMDGFTLCHSWVHDEGLKGIPFIFYTSTYTDLEDEDLAKSLGARRFLRKPVEPTDLLRIVEDVLAESASDGRAATGAPPMHDETEYLRAYSERLVEKLEHKTEELVESRDSLQAILSSSPLGITVTDLEGRITSCNPATLRIHGFDSEDEIVGRSSLDFIVPEQHELAMQRMQSTIDRGTVTSVPYTLVTRDGREFPGELSASVIRDAPGQPIGFVAITQDISKRQQALDRLKSALRGAVGALGVITEAKDPYTAGHQRRVTQLALAIAAGLGLDAPRKDALRLAGLMHDIGKVAIPAEILVKPTQLTETEYALIQTHPETAWNILSQIEFEGSVATIVRQHHERTDGSGYPDGLRGEEILLEARILAVADTVEAMSSHRPYRAALGIEQALAEIKEGAGARYDEVVAEACIAVFESGGFAFEE